MTKRKDSQKLNHKEHDFKQHQKEEKMRNKERLKLLGDGHKTGSGTQGAKQGNQ